MANSRFWTSDKVDFLKENYATKGAKYCADCLECSISSVHSKANREGIKSRKNQKKTHEEYQKELRTRNIQFFPLEKYIDSHTPILHQCMKGHQTSLRPYSVLTGRGCRKCDVANRTKTHETYLEEVGKLSSNTIEVLDEYVNSITPIRHKCSYGHIWKARPNGVLSSKHGCPECSTKGFNYNKPAILYYIKVTSFNLTYYKVGITNNTVKERFKREPETTDIVIIKEVQFARGLDAREEEQRILTQYSEHRQKVPELLISGGNTELFEFDILGLDT